MPRFNPERWKPFDDSSPGYRTEDPKSVVLHVALTESNNLGCPCGCGDFPMSTKTTFCMGHDARLRGILIRAHLMGVRIRYSAGGTLGDPQDAYDVAEQYGWRPYLDSAVLRREGKNRELLRKALKSERLVKVGRWEFTGQVVAAYRHPKDRDMFEIEYVNRAGDIKHKRVAASATEEIA